MGELSVGLGVPDRLYDVGRDRRREAGSVLIRRAADKAGDGVQSGDPDDVSGLAVDEHVPWHERAADVALSPAETAADGFSRGIGVELQLLGDQGCGLKRARCRGDVGQLALLASAKSLMRSMWS